MPVSSTSSSFSSVYNKCLELEAKINELAERCEQQATSTANTSTKEEIDNLSIATHSMKETITDIDINTTNNIAAIAELKKKVASLEKSIPMTVTANKSESCSDEARQEILNRLTELENSVSALDVKLSATTAMAEKIVKTEEDVQNIISNVSNLKTRLEEHLAQTSDFESIIEEAKEAAASIEKAAKDELYRFVNATSMIQNFIMAAKIAEPISVELPGVYNYETTGNQIKQYEGVVDVNGVIYLTPFELGDTEDQLNHTDELLVYTVIDSLKTTTENDTPNVEITIPQYLVIRNDDETFSKYRIRTFFPILEKGGLYSNKRINAIHMNWIEKLVSVHYFCCENINQPMISLPRCELIQGCNYFGASKSFCKETYLEIPITCRLLPSVHSEEMRRAWNVLAITNQFNSYLSSIWCLSRVDRSLRTQGDGQNFQEGTIYNKKHNLIFDSSSVDFENRRNADMRGKAFRTFENRYSDNNRDGSMPYNLFYINEITLSEFDKFACEHPIVDNVVPYVTDADINADFGQEEIVKAMHARRNGVQVDICRIPTFVLPAHDNDERLVSADIKTRVTYKVENADGIYEDEDVYPVDAAWNIRDSIKSFIQSTCKGLLLWMRQIYSNKALRNIVLSNVDKSNNPLRFVFEACEALLGNITNYSADVTEEQQVSNVNKNYINNYNEADDKGSHTILAYLLAATGCDTNATQESEKANNTMLGTSALWFDNYIAENAVNAAMIKVSTLLNGGVIPEPTDIGVEYHESGAKHTDIFGIPRNMVDGKPVIPSTMTTGYEVQTYRKVIKYFDNMYSAFSGNFVKTFEKLVSVIEDSFFLDSSNDEIAATLLANSAADPSNRKKIEAAAAWRMENKTIGAYVGNSLDGWYQPNENGTTAPGVTLPGRSNYQMKDTRDNKCVLPFNTEEKPVTSLIYATNKSIMISSVFNLFTQLFIDIADVIREHVYDAEFAPIIDNSKIQILSDNTKNNFHESILVGSKCMQISNLLARIAYANYAVMNDSAPAIVDGDNQYLNIPDMVEKLNHIVNEDENKWLERMTNKYSFNDVDLVNVINGIKAAIENHAGEYLFGEIKSSAVSKFIDQGANCYYVPAFYLNTIMERYGTNAKIWNESVWEEVDHEINGYLYTTNESDVSIMSSIDGVSCFYHNPMHITVMREYTKSSKGDRLSENRRIIFYTTDTTAGYYLDTDTASLAIEKPSTQIGYRYCLIYLTYNSSAKKWQPQYHKQAYLPSYNKVRDIDNFDFLMNDVMLLNGLVGFSILNNPRISYASDIPTLFGEKSIADILLCREHASIPLYLGLENVPSARMIHWFGTTSVARTGPDRDVLALIPILIKNAVSVRLYAVTAAASPYVSLIPYCASYACYQALFHGNDFSEEKDILPYVETFRTRLLDYCNYINKVISDKDSYDERDIRNRTMAFSMSSMRLVDQLLKKNNTTIMAMFDAKNVASWIDKLQHVDTAQVLESLNTDPVYVEEEKSFAPNMDVEVPPSLTEYSAIKHAACEIIAISYVAEMIGSIISGNNTAIIGATATNLSLIASNKANLIINAKRSEEDKRVRIENTYTYVNDNGEMVTYDCKYMNALEIVKLADAMFQNEIDCTDVFSPVEYTTLSDNIKRMMILQYISIAANWMLQDNLLKSSAGYLSDISYTLDNETIKTYLRSIKFLPSTSGSLIGESSPYAIDRVTSFVPPTYTKEGKIYTFPLNSATSIGEMDPNTYNNSEDNNTIFHNFTIYLPATVFNFDSFVGEVKYNGKVIKAEPTGLLMNETRVVNSFLPRNYCEAVEPFGKNAANINTKMVNAESAFVTSARVMSYEFNGVPACGNDVTVVDGTNSDRYEGLWPVHNSDLGADYPLVSMKSRFSGISLNTAFGIFNSNFLVGRVRIVPRLDNNGQPENVYIDADKHFSMKSHFDSIDTISSLDNFEPCLSVATTLTAPVASGRYSEYLPCDWNKNTYKAAFLRAPITPGGELQPLDNAETYGDYTYDDDTWINNSGNGDLEGPYGFCGEMFHGTMERYYRFY